MKVIKIEYMFQESTWKCSILATDTKDAIKFLEGFLKAEFKIMGTEEVCTIHGISGTVLSSFNISTNKKEEKKKGPGRPPKSKE